MATNIQNELTDMTNDIERQIIERLAVLETKLDGLYENTGKGEHTVAELANRLDILENQKQLVVGACAVFSTLIGVIAFAATGYIDGRIKSKLADVEFIEEVCAEFRDRRSVSDVVPNICKL